jgi:hypothetical protein|tara:strand:- start:199 stop:453 length:255 start_codon:yes stop_codon:yes gene_type:complete
MVEYQGKKVTVRTKVKHELSDVVIAWVNQVVKNPEDVIVDWNQMTAKEQEEFERQAFLLEGKLHKVIGVAFAEIISSSNYTKKI